MTKQKTSLQQAVVHLANCETQEEKISALNEAFEVFNQETQRLEQAYHILKEQFKIVNLELESTNTQLKKKVLQLDTTTRYLNGILTNLSQGIIFIDLSGTITTYNETAEQILGAKNIDVLLNKFWDHFDDELFGFSIKKILKIKKSPSVSLKRILNLDNEYREIEVHTKFILHPEPEAISTDLDTLECIQGVILLFRDLTDMHYLQNLANQNDRMKELGEMAAMLAHEIRNPLGGIKGFAALLLRDLKEQTDLQQMAHFIIEGTNNLNNLVTNILNYSKPFSIHLETRDLIALIHELHLSLTADKSLNNNITIHIKSSLERLTLPFDPHLLKSALLNILMNAMQAMPKGGTITIDIKQNNQMAVLKMSDTGTGISKENLEKIFCPFFTTKSEGTGLGLCEANKVIQAHAGRLEVTSKPNQGTTFTIELPLRAFARN